ncbi:Neuronal acetylcholine receptor subunit alpha-3 [Mizuhopecten yessoensis]|uniref:Neuronal acetylcholine receptor subunit alpha-3 n=1 Tax=Mizuhopecten yessoensis TaxID=6573 RepID=A0A210R3H0_MIZYE|nr:Neuronal acetylcholine receptor subunit alpha-3 [Mizuhopecten yessoensis]
MSLYEELLGGYKTSFRPGINYMYLERPLILSVSFALKTIKTFDELNSKFSIVGNFRFGWYDERLIWNPKQYNGITFMSFKEKDVWIPPIGYLICYDNVDLLGDSDHIISFSYNGKFTWVPPQILDSVCNAYIM